MHGVVYYLNIYFIMDGGEGVWLFFGVLNSCLMFSALIFFFYLLPFFLFLILSSFSSFLSLSLFFVYMCVCVWCVCVCMYVNRLLCYSDLKTHLMCVCVHVCERLGGDVFEGLQNIIIPPVFQSLFWATLRLELLEELGIHKPIPGSMTIFRAYLSGYSKLQGICLGFFWSPPPCHKNIPRFCEET